MKYLKRRSAAVRPWPDQVAAGSSIPCTRLRCTLMKHSNDAFNSFPQSGAESIFLCYALIVLFTGGALTPGVLPKLEHPSSRKSVRTGDGSSIKGLISDDKDLEMNGPCHSTGSLSSERATTALWTAATSFRAVFAKQPRLKLLIAMGWTK